MHSILLENSGVCVSSLGQGPMWNSVSLQKETMSLNYLEEGYLQVR